MLRTAGQVRGLAGCGLFELDKVPEACRVSAVENYLQSENWKRTETIPSDSGHSRDPPTWTLDAKNHTNFFSYTILCL